MRLTQWILLPALALPLAGATCKDLFNGRNLDGWQTVGNGIWKVMRDGTVLGQRPHPRLTPFKEWPLTRQQYSAWTNPHAWLYTVAEYDQFDLRLDYLIPVGGNSGVSIRDSSRARYAVEGPEFDGRKTPSHIGYEIQIIDEDNQKYPSGSIYLFAPARTGLHRIADWNTLEIEVRHETIRVKLNGVPAAESAGDPARPKVGPIGLQLHDRFSWILFRNVRIREVKQASGPPLTR